ncbi:MAG TPA: tetratricopeptide repeat protein [Ferruginibacter sp.]|nr:tetratricopeptide repeat protein [Ferruginibacter sp.]
MKKSVALLCFLFTMQVAFTQRLDVDSLIRKIAAEKDEDKKLDLTIGFYTTSINNDPAYPIEIGLKLLRQSQLDKSIISETSAYSFLGHGYRLSGNNIKALEYHHKAIALAETSGNPSLLSVANLQLAHIYKDRGEFDKAIQIYNTALRDGEQGKNDAVKYWPLGNLGSVYLMINKLDSSLMYSQRAYEAYLRVKDSNLQMLAFLNLAGVHSKMNNVPLAMTYYNMAILSAGASNPRYLNMVYSSMAEHYRGIQQIDSAKLYAGKGIAAVSNSPFFYLSSKPAQLLAGIYENNNCDSALKYARLFKTANDSLTSSKANQQIMLMTFDEDLRKEEAAAEKIKLAEERQKNIQYVLIALGIIVLVTVYLLLSRSFITNTRLIEFFGVVALLIVFEFLNLLLHPFLERITHHSPVLMLAALVCIAALLVPLHHKVEKWATAKLVEKNKQIRLSAAKKTIEKLEGENLQKDN